MSNQSYPLEPTLSQRRPSARCNVTLERLMAEPATNRKTPIGTDTAWAMKLKNCVDAVARELQINVLAAKPVRCFDPLDARDMLFEVDTSRGTLEVLRSRTGEHTYNWKSENALVV